MLRHRDRAAHRVRQHRESAAGARRRPRHGHGRPSGPGARRGQLITQLLTESVLLACLGALAGLLVAYWTLAGIATLAPPEVVGALGFGLRPVVLVFAALLALATGIVFGVFPAWHSTRTELVTTIRANAGQISGARSAARFRSSLVTVQIALATT